MNAPLVYIVVLNWNGRDETLACLSSVMRLTYPNFRVLVVDNGSSDSSVPAIRATFPDLELIETGNNLGFAGGNNVGILHAMKQKAAYVLLLNNDTEVDPSLLDAFVTTAQRFPDAGAFSGKIYFHAEPNRIWYAGATWNPETASFNLLGEGVLDDGVAFSATGETAYACGCAFFLSASRLQDVGLLDEDFFLYFEETDWCFKAKAAGHPSIFVPEAKLWHKVSVSFGGEGSPLALYFITRNRLLWAKRHGEPSKQLRIYANTIASLFRRFIVPLFSPCRYRHFTPRNWWWSLRETFNDPANRAFYLGVQDFCLGRFGDCPPAVREFAQQSRLGEKTKADSASQARTT